MRWIADGIWQLEALLQDTVNCYLVEDVLIDTGTRWARSRLLRQLRHHPLRMVALTHCHPDHQGCASLLCKRRNLPLACHEADVPAMEGRTPMQPDNWLLRFGDRIWSGPPHPVTKVLREGDEVAGFRVVHAPGHTPGHILFFRESDRLAIAGDLFSNFNFLTWQPGLSLPPWFFSINAAENRRSIAKLIQLQPRLVCFGHGPPLREPEQMELFLKQWV